MVLFFELGRLALRTAGRERGDELGLHFGPGWRGAWTELVGRVDLRCEVVRQA